MEPELAPLSLSEDIRPALIRQEETIIFAMIERSQFVVNDPCYRSGEDNVLPHHLHSSADLELSLLDFFLSETEIFQAKLGRYSSPEEHAFFYDQLRKLEDIPANRVSPRGSQKVKPNGININNRIKHVYLNAILPKMCSEGEDSENFGSTCWCDIAVLQAISKRIHYGKFVAEAKFQLDTEKFSKLIMNNDAEGLMQALTHEAVEKAVIDRVRMKASHYGTDGTHSAYKVDPELIARLYEEFLIPLNKDVQVQYLLQRLSRPKFAFLNVKVEATESWESSSAEAGEKFFNSTADENLACESINEVFLAVLTNKVAFGVVPIEHPKLGLNKQSQINLVKSNLKIVDCVTIKKERHFIIGKVSRSREEVTADTNRVVLFFTTKHEPGSLLKALKCLDGMNLFCLESTPGYESTSNNSYIFYCEVETAGNSVEETKKQLKSLEEETNSLSIVGYYHVV